MNITNPNFISVDYGFIRHAQDVCPEGVPMIHGNSRDYLLMNCARLIGRIPQDKVAVFYSLTKRTFLTATIITEALRDFKAVTAVKLLPWLGCIELDELNRKGSTNERVQQLLDEHPETFLIFVSHQECIAEYADIDENNILNCSFHAQEFSFAGHEKFKT